MNIYILSSDPRTTRFLSRVITAYGQQKYVEIETRIFRHMKDYLMCFEYADVIIIDDNFEMRPSVENGKIVRTRDAKAALILLSVNAERVFDAFEIKAHRFLMKPLTQSDIFDALDSYRKDLFSYRIIIVKVETGFQVFSSEEIFAVTSLGKRAQIVTRTERVDTLTPYSQVESQLPEEYFYKCHRSYIVNMKHIATVGTEEVTLVNEAVIPVSRRKKTDFLLQYSEFVKGHTFKE